MITPQQMVKRVTVIRTQEIILLPLQA